MCVCAYANASLCACSKPSLSVKRGVAWGGKEGEVAGARACGAPSVLDPSRKSRNAAIPISYTSGSLFLVR
jgi:hypothetical protein